jgi:hypothetical protein
MPFITPSDYKAKIKDRHLLQIIEDDPEVQTIAESTALGFIESAIFQRYDSEHELALVGSDRNQVLLWYATSIVLYTLFERVDDEIVPESVIKNYDDTMKALELIEGGEKPLKLKKLEVDADGDGIIDPVSKFRLGSDNPRDFQLN